MSESFVSFNCVSPSRIGSHPAVFLLLQSYISSANSLDCHTVLGPFPFEKWHMRGRSYSEPNNAWCDEHCGSFNLDISPPMWNDLHCNKKFPFICEISECVLVISLSLVFFLTALNFADMPASCHYNPPNEDDCVFQLFSEV